MEGRLLIAYGLLTAMALIVMVAGGLVARRRAARRRRLRGIKDYNTQRSRG